MRFEGAKRLALTAAFRPRITAIAELRAMSGLLSTTRFQKHLAVVCRSLVIRGTTSMPRPQDASTHFPVFSVCRGPNAGFVRHRRKVCGHTMMRYSQSQKSGIAKRIIEPSS